MIKMRDDGVLDQGSNYGACCSPWGRRVWCGLTTKQEEIVEIGRRGWTGVVFWRYSWQELQFRWMWIQRHKGQSRISTIWTSLVVQWWRLHASTAEGTGSIPVGEVLHVASVHPKKIKSNTVCQDEEFCFLFKNVFSPIFLFFFNTAQVLGSWFPKQGLNPGP